MKGGLKEGAHRSPAPWFDRQRTHAHRHINREAAAMHSHYSVFLSVSFFRFFPKHDVTKHLVQLYLRIYGGGGGGGV